MASNKDLRNIIETAKSIISGNLHQNEKVDFDNQKLNTINKAIITIKESFITENLDVTDKLSSFKTLCLSKNLMVEDEISKIKSSKELLFKLKKIRKIIKDSLLETDEETSLESHSNEILYNNIPYTLQALSEEFSVSPSKISIDFIKNKRTLSCGKMNYLLSQYDYCCTLHDNLKYLNEIHGYKSIEQNISQDNKTRFNFDEISKIAENAIDAEFPEANRNQSIMSYLSQFAKKLTKEIDIHCNKIDLIDTYIQSMDKSNAPKMVKKTSILCEKTISSHSNRSELLRSPQDDNLLYH